MSKIFKQNLKKIAKRSQTNVENSENDIPLPKMMSKSQECQTLSKKIVNIENVVANTKISELLPKL